MEIFVADDEMNFKPHQTFDEIISIRKRVDSMKLTLMEWKPKQFKSFQSTGLGHQWGEVEFWIHDDGRFEESISGLAPGETYYFVLLLPTKVGHTGLPERKHSLLRKMSNTITASPDKYYLGNLEPYQWGLRIGEVSETTFIDDFGNSHP